MYLPWVDLKMWTLGSRCTCIFHFVELAKLQLDLAHLLPSFMEILTCDTQGPAKREASQKWGVVMEEASLRPPEVESVPQSLPAV